MDVFQRISKKQMNENMRCNCSSDSHRRDDYQGTKENKCCLECTCYVRKNEELESDSLN